MTYGSLQWAGRSLNIARTRHEPPWLGSNHSQHLGGLQGESSMHPLLWRVCARRNCFVQIQAKEHRIEVSLPCLLMHYFGDIQILNYIQMMHPSYHGD